jgi:hypothetical protein
VDGSALLVRLLKPVWRLVRDKAPVDERDAFLRGHEVHRRPQELLTMLDEHGFTYECRSYGHVGLKETVSPAMRRRLIWALSFPWRRGDMLFVLASLQAS